MKTPEGLLGEKSAPKLQEPTQKSDTDGQETTRYSDAKLRPDDAKKGDRNHFRSPFSLY
jgi:hypothetical protein